MNVSMLYATNTFVSYNYPLEEANVIFIGVPFSSTNISTSSMYGPLMVREALKLVETETNKGNVFEKLKICDAGDVEIVPGSYELTAQRIRETVQEMRKINPSAFLVVVGGEHLITLPLVETLKPKTIVQIDAHADTDPEYMGAVYSHATWAFHAAKRAHIYQYGMRNTKMPTNVSLLDISMLPTIEQPLHMTIDIDAFAASHIGETGFYEGRLSPENVFDIIDKADVKSLDIVEIADRTLPSKSGFLAARLIVKALSKLL